MLLRGRVAILLPLLLFLALAPTSNNLFQTDENVALPAIPSSVVPAPINGIIWVEVIPVLTSDFPAAPSTESLATTMFTNADSVAAYWEEVSRSAITVEGRVNPWVRLPTDLVGCGPGLCVQQSLDLFTTELTPPTSTPSKTLVLLIYAQSDDVLNGDADNDGSSSDQNSIWPGHYPLSSSLNHSGQIIDHVSFCSIECTTGQLSRLMAESFGLPALHDESGRSNGVGIYSLMGSGHLATHNGRSNPTYLDPWSRIQLGWNEVEVYDVNDGTEEFKDVYPAHHPDAGIIQLEYDSDITYLIEFRDTTDEDIIFDRGLSCQGIIVWKIDKGEFNSDDLPTNDGSKPSIEVLEADGDADLSDPIKGNHGDSEDCFLEGHLFADTTSPSFLGEGDPALLIKSIVDRPSTKARLLLLEEDDRALFLNDPVLVPSVSDASAANGGYHVDYQISPDSGLSSLKAQIYTRPSASIEGGKITPLNVLDSFQPSPPTAQFATTTPDLPELIISDSLGPALLDVMVVLTDADGQIVDQRMTDAPIFIEPLSDIDMDAIPDYLDLCWGNATHISGWISTIQTDQDHDGCQDVGEDAFPMEPTQHSDVDGDGLGDDPNGNDSDPCPLDPAPDCEGGTQVTIDYPPADIHIDSERSMVTVTRGEDVDVEVTPSSKPPHPSTTDDRQCDVEMWFVDRQEGLRTHAVGSTQRALEFPSEKSVDVSETMLRPGEIQVWSVLICEDVIEDVKADIIEVEWTAPIVTNVQSQVRNLDDVGGDDAIFAQIEILNPTDKSQELSITFQAHNVNDLDGWNPLTISSTTVVLAPAENASVPSTSILDTAFTPEEDGESWILEVEISGDDVEFHTFYGDDGEMLFLEDGEWTDVHGPIAGHEVSTSDVQGFELDSVTIEQVVDLNVNPIDSDGDLLKDILRITYSHITDPFGGSIRLNLSFTNTDLGHSGSIEYDHLPLGDSIERTVDIPLIGLGNYSVTITATDPLNLIPTATATNIREVTESDTLQASITLDVSGPVNLTLSDSGPCVIFADINDPAEPFWGPGDLSWQGPPDMALNSAQSRVVTCSDLVSSGRITAYYNSTAGMTLSTFVDIMILEEIITIPDTNTTGNTTDNQTTNLTSNIQPSTQKDESSTGNVWMWSTLILGAIVIMLLIILILNTSNRPKSMSPMGPPAMYNHSDPYGHASHESHHPTHPQNPPQQVLGDPYASSNPYGSPQSNTPSTWTDAEGRNWQQFPDGRTEWWDGNSWKPF